MRDYKGLGFWKKAYKLTLEVYKYTNDFPVNEKYGLTSQLRRSATSIHSNIAEGCGKYSELDFARFLEIALGSSMETDNHLSLAKDLGYISDEIFSILNKELDSIKKMMSSYLIKIYKKHKKRS